MSPDASIVFSIAQEMNERDRGELTIDVDDRGSLLDVD